MVKIINAKKLRLSADAATAVNPDRNKRASLKQRGKVGRPSSYVDDNMSMETIFGAAPNS